MPPRSLMFGGLALALAVVAVLLGRTVLQRGDEAAAATPPASVAATKVLVALRPLGIGHVVAAGDFGWRSWPEDGVDAGYVSTATGKLTAFTGQVVRSAMVTGEPATANRLIAPGAKGALAAVTASGMRAVSIAITLSSGVSGLVIPGDRVDVILTHVLPGAAAGQERRAALTVLRNIRVIAIDPALSASGRDRADSGTASLEVTPKQSEILALAAEMGKLTLSLRALNPGSDTAAGAVTVDNQISALLGALPRPGAAMAATASGLASVSPGPLAAPAPVVPSGPQVSLFHGSTAESRVIAR